MDSPILTTTMGKDLYKLLKTSDHPLEKYILAFDTYLDDDNTLHSIADRIGIFIPENDYSVYILYDRLKDYLEKETDPEITRKLVNMTYDDFAKMYPSFTQEKLDAMFSDRLRN